jgi:NAD(P) transhydrogenase subunit alpha
MTYELGISDVYIFILAGFLGFQLITRIPPLLHTPLMAATNAISGIALVGSIAVLGQDSDFLTNSLAFVAVVCSTVNVVGGFLITDRILKMFKKETKEQAR